MKQVNVSGTAEVSREEMGGEYVTMLKLPKNPKSDTMPDGTPYLSWGHAVTGGFINAFLFGGAPAEGTRTVKVRARIREKTLPNGKKFLYLRYEIAADDDVVTHDIKIYGHVVDVPDNFENAFSRFDCVGAPKGSVVVIEQ